MFDRRGQAVTDLGPLRLTRPAFELILGASSLEDKSLRPSVVTGAPCCVGQLSGHNWRPSYENATRTLPSTTATG